MKTALIVVDFQNDFRKGGVLEAEKSEEILEPLLKLAEEVDYVVASRDWHPKNHASFSDTPNFEDTWPVHCVQDTEGCEIAPEILAVTNSVINKGFKPDQDAYSAFDGCTDTEGFPLTKWLNERSVDTVIVGGLVTEVCVMATAISARQEGFRTVVNVHAAASLTEEGGKKALNEMKQRRIHISYREPTGETMKRDAALIRAVETISIEAAEAERLGNRNLNFWLDNLVTWLDQYVTEHPEPFMIAFPNFTYEDVATITIPEAETSMSGT